MRITAVLSVVAIAIAIAPGVSATTFVLASTEDLLKRSEAVIVGRVDAIRGVDDGTTLHTHIDVQVEDIAKGQVGTTVTVVEPGGSVGHRGRWIHGAPTFFVGEHVVLFLHRKATGELETTFLGMGKFRVVSSSSGTAFAVRNLADVRTLAAAGGRLVAAATVTTHRLEDLLAEVRQRASTAESSGWAPAAAYATSPPGSQFETHFTFASMPVARWFQPDTGEALIYRTSTAADAALGPDDSAAAVREALAAWSSPPCTTLRLFSEGTAPPGSFNMCDGVTEITFDDPFDEIDDPINCSGILAVGGFCTDTSTAASFSGLTAYRITEGDVMVNNGFGGCPFWNEVDLAELLTHEVGHSIGLGHSSEDPNESDPSLRNATMYYAAHFDGRGAQIMSDDIAAVCTLYPAGEAGSVSFRRFAIVSEADSPSTTDRLVVEGTLQLTTDAFHPQSDTLIIDLRTGGSSVYRLAVSPNQWRMNPSGTRLRYRRGTGLATTILTVSARPAGALRFRLVATGLDLAAARVEPLFISLALGSASVSHVMPELRESGRARVYP